MPADAGNGQQLSGDTDFVLAPETVVWIRSTTADEAFELATVKESLGGGCYSVLTAAGAEKALRAAECSLANPDKVVVADACLLVHISESTILANLRERFERVCAGLCAHASATLCFLPCVEPPPPARVPSTRSPARSCRP